LANPHITNIFEELKKAKVDGKQVSCESQSGLDGRILLSKSDYAKMIRSARFKNVKIAWDGRVSNHEDIKNQIDVLRSAGYKTNKGVEISVFMLYNSTIDFDEISRKLEWCRRWGVLVNDCRYRPLNSLYDNYNPRSKQQTSEEYYISNNWTDKNIRLFRRMVRRQNIAIMLGLPGNRYIEGVEKGYVRAN
jgi:hypothetical protein